MATHSQDESCCENYFAGFHVQSINKSIQRVNNYSNFPWQTGNRKSSLQSWYSSENLLNDEYTICSPSENCNSSISVKDGNREHTDNDSMSIKNACQVSPEIFSDEEVVASCSSCVQPRDINNVNKYEVRRLEEIKMALSGISPSRKITHKQLSFDEIYESLQRNRSSLLILPKENNCLEKGVPVWKPWPQILNQSFQGLHYNRNKLSEELEHLCLKYTKRYIGMETYSTFTVFRKKFSSSNKENSNPYRWNATSPGSRLSHLARRRLSFSNPALQFSSSAGSRARQIVIDARRLELLSRRNKVVKKQEPSKVLNLPHRFLVKDNPKFDSSAEFSAPSSVSSTNSDKIEATKRALFRSPQIKINTEKLPPLQSIENFDVLARNRVQSSPSCSSATSATSSQSGEINAIYKKKLQWAVYETLRSRHITVSHLHFKVYASVLARVIRRLLPTGVLLENGLSDKMVAIANLHVSSVISGKTVDEIVKSDAKRRNHGEHKDDRGMLKERRDSNNREDDNTDKKELPYYIREARRDMENEESRPTVQSTFLARLRCAQKKNLLHFR